MKYLFISLFVGLVTVVSVVYTSFSSNILKFHQYQEIIDSNDQGHAENCGKYNFSLTWTPKVISGRKPVTVRFYMVAPLYIDKATVSFDVFMFGQFIIEYLKDGRCSDVAKVVPSLKCPIKKGDPLIYTHTFYPPFKTTKLPTGNFSSQVNITTREGMPFCAKANIIFVD